MGSAAYANKKSQQLRLNSPPQFEDTEFTDVPTFTRCPRCSSSIVTKTWQKKKKPKCCCSCLTCLLHPTIVRIFRDTIHSCPRCCCEITTYNRFGMGLFKPVKSKMDVPHVLKYKTIDTTNICSPVAIQMEEKEDGTVTVSVERKTGTEDGDDDQSETSENTRLLPSLEKIKEGKKVKKRKSFRGKVTGGKKRQQQNGRNSDQ